MTQRICMVTVLIAPHQGERVAERVCILVGQ